MADMFDLHGSKLSRHMLRQGRGCTAHAGVPLCLLLLLLLIYIIGEIVYMVIDPPVGLLRRNGGVLL